MAHHVIISHDDCVDGQEFVTSHCVFNSCVMMDVPHWFDFIHLGTPYVIYCSLEKLLTAIIVKLFIQNLDNLHAIYLFLTVGTEVSEITF